MLWSVAIATALSADAPTPPRILPTPAQALAVILRGNPRVLGVGEVHSTTAGPEVPSTLSRFTTQIFPFIAPKTTDLVLETWHLDGTCGQTAVAVTEQVEADTKRPEATKTDLEVLVELSVALRVRPHDLPLSCDEYASLLDADGNVAYGTLLQLLKSKLQDFALRGIAATDATLVLYGGAVHNDLFPKDELAQYSYGTEARKAGGGSYVELDLYAPELVRGNEALAEAGLEEWLAMAGPNHVVLVERGADSFVLILPTSTSPR